MNTEEKLERATKLIDRLENQLAESQKKKNKLVDLIGILNVKVCKLEED